jgi:hypothetical protein
VNSEQAKRTCQCGGVEPALASELITSPVWFDDHDPEDLSPRPFALRMELPVSAELMTAALYSYGKGPYVLDADCVWGLVAVVIVQDGLNAVDDYVHVIRDEEEYGTVRHPEFLALCRQIVSRVTGSVMTEHAMTPADRTAHGLGYSTRKPKGTVTMRDTEAGPPGGGEP